MMPLRASPVNVPGWQVVIAGIFTLVAIDGLFRVAAACAVTPVGAVAEAPAADAVTTSPSGNSRTHKAMMVRRNTRLTSLLPSGHCQEPGSCASVTFTVAALPSALVTLTITC